MKLLRTWVLHNWPLKVLALLGAFLLWASYTAEPMAEVVYNAPIVFFNLPEGLTVSGDEITLTHVVLRGRMRLLRRIQPSDLAVNVDMRSAREGETLVQLRDAHIDSPPGAEIARIAPDAIRVVLVRR